MASGACNCGGITFRIKTELPDVIVCHCSICRRATGSNGIAVLVVDNESFEWTSGEELIAYWKKPGADWETWFCGRCGSPVPGSNDETQMFIPAGLVREGGEHLKIAHHIWVPAFLNPSTPRGEVRAEPVWGYPFHTALSRITGG